MQVHGNAEDWLRQNLDIDLDDLPVISENQSRASGHSRVHSAKHGRRQIMTKAASQANFTGKGNAPQLSEAYLRNFEARSNQGSARKIRSTYSRPMSAATHTTAMASHMSILPNIDVFQVKQVAHVLMESRKAVVAYANRPGSKVTLRDTISSTQIY